MECDMPDWDTPGILTALVDVGFKASSPLQGLFVIQLYQTIEFFRLRGLIVSAVSRAGATKFEMKFVYDSQSVEMKRVEIQVA